MSKFKNNAIIGNGNIVGDGNTISNNNIRNYNYHNNGNNKNDGNAIAIGFLVAALAAIWFLLGNFNQIYLALELTSLGSMLFVFIGYSVLLYKNELENKDIGYGITSLVFMAAVFFVIQIIRTSTPDDLIRLANTSSSPVQYFLGLNGYGKNLAISVGTSTICMIFCTGVNLLISIKQLSYSLADYQQSGFWFTLFRLVNLFKRKNGFIFISIFLIFSIFSVKGLIFNFF